MHKQRQHILKIEKELRNVGIKTYGLMKSETKELPHILSENETIKGCIYGQYKGGSGMMVATNKRLIFLDKKPMHLLMEEMTYESIVDIGADWQPFFSKVTVNARAEKYVFKYVNSRCARIFVRYLETAVLGMPKETESAAAPTKKSLLSTPVAATQEESLFLAGHSVCVVSTVGTNGYPYGATMFYFADQSENTIRLVTRSETETARNLLRNKKVALTITDMELLATMHILGVAELDTSPKKGYEILQQLIKGHASLPKNVLPPVTQITQGAYVIFSITIQSSYIRVYKNTP